MAKRAGIAVAWLGEGASGREGIPLDATGPPTNEVAEDNWWYMDNQHLAYLAKGDTTGATWNYGNGDYFYPTVTNNGVAIMVNTMTLTNTFEWQPQRRWAGPYGWVYDYVGQWVNRRSAPTWGVDKYNRISVTCRLR